MTAVGRMGATGLLVQTSRPVALWRQLRSDPPPGVIDVVAGATSVLLIYDPGGSGAPEEPPVWPDVEERPEATGRDITVPVAYDGPDLDDLVRITGLTRTSLAEIHSDALYSVSFLGFSPGFAYMTGTDERLDVPRLERPRTSVPAGSVAIAAGLTAIYPQATPGGWRLVGRTDVPLFDPHADPPALLQPGDRVRFAMSKAVGAAPSWPNGALLTGDRHGPRLEVLDVGVRLTVQDEGRSGWAHAGVPRGGAADRASARCANSLVGNTTHEAVLEATLGGCRLRMMTDRRVAVTGARCDLSVNGLPARVDASLAVPAGAEVLVGPARSGIHAYLAVEGGIEVEAVLGSRSCDTLSGLGPPPLRAGDVVGLGRPVSGTTSGVRRATAIPAAGSSVTVTARPGPDAASLESDGLDLLASTPWKVGIDSDRTGTRLLGPRLPGAGSVPSAGVVAGAIQVPPGGQPVVLLRNHPPTGGYPVVAVVDGASVDVLSQCRPGTTVRIDLSR